MTMIEIPTRILTIDSHAFHYHVRIPDDGFTIIQLLRMTYLLDVTVPWLVGTLSNSRFNGIAGNVVSDLHMSFTLNPMRERDPVEATPSSPERPPTTQTTWQFNSLENVPSDETCAICLETGTEDPSKGWSTVEGCSTHKFHTDCIQGWAAAGTCPMCRMPWMEL
jgi:hypothetical protein